MIRERKKIPLYQRIKDDLRNKIQKGKYGINRTIPTEKALSQEYKASVITIRQAVNGLVSEGLLQKIQGSGTYVRNTRVEKELGIIISFTADMKRKRLRAGAKILSKEVIPATKGLKTSLSLQGKDQVIRIKRIRYANSLPLMLEEVNLPYGMCHPVLGEDLEKISLHDFIKNKLGLVLARVNQEIEAIQVGKDTAGLLSIKKGRPALLIKQTIYTDKNIPIEYNQAVYQCDKYKFVLNHHL